MSEFTLVTPGLRSNGVHSHPGTVRVALVVGLFRSVSATAVRFLFAVDSEHSDTTLDVCGRIAGCS